MSSSSTNDALALLNLIDKLGRLEWQRYQGRTKKIFVDNRIQEVDCSKISPYCSFRFEREDDNLISRLNRAVEQYIGQTEWIMVSRDREGVGGKNWTICPKRYWQVREQAEEVGKSPGQYLAEIDGTFGPMAHEDFVGLFEFVRAELQGE